MDTKRFTTETLSQNSRSTPIRARVCRKKMQDVLFPISHRYQILPAGGQECNAKKKQCGLLQETVWAKQLYCQQLAANVGNHLAEVCPI